MNWKITCRSEAGPSVSEGSITYRDTTYKGESAITAQGITMHSRMSGRYIGPCN